MKTILLILSLLLSLFSADKSKADAAVSSDTGSFCYAEASSCVTAPLGQSFNGDGSPNSISLRTTNMGRRTYPQTRCSFRVIKDGKVIDNNRTHPFLTPLFVILSGTRISERYLFSICRLRL